MADAAVVDQKLLGQETARRKELYGKPNARPIGLCEPGRHEVYDADGRRVARFATSGAARRFVDGRVRLQPHDKENKPIGDPTKPGVRVECDGQETHAVKRPARSKGG